MATGGYPTTTTVLAKYCPKSDGAQSLNKQAVPTGSQTGENGSDVEPWITTDTDRRSQRHLSSLLRAQTWKRCMGTQIIEAAMIIRDIVFCLNALVFLFLCCRHQKTKKEMNPILSNLITFVTWWLWDNSQLCGCHFVWRAKYLRLGWEKHLSVVEGG